jgi:hypothetical protein
VNLSIALLALRGVSLALSLQGQKSAASTINLLADSAEAGLNVDARMAEVAQALKSGEPIDWDDVRARIEADAADLHRDPPGG